MADRGAIVVVAIDGPAGSGKSTVAKKLAKALDLDYLDTGAMYRAVTLAALNRGIDPRDHDGIAALGGSVRIDLQADGTVNVDGVDATRQIRSPEVTSAVSAVAANPELRSALVSQQRDWARSRGGGVLEGRDIGTVVFPDADLKVYLTASPEVRARRRAVESRAGDVAAVAADLARRDAFDSGRDHDPLRQADDAITVDTSDLSIDEVVEKLVALLEVSGRR